MHQVVPDPVPAVVLVDVEVLDDQVLCQVEVPPNLHPVELAAPDDLAPVGILRDDVRAIPLVCHAVLQDVPVRLPPHLLSQLPHPLHVRAVVTGRRFLHHPHEAFGVGRFCHALARPDLDVDRELLREDEFGVAPLHLRCLQRPVRTRYVLSPQLHPHAACPPCGSRGLPALGEIPAGGPEEGGGGEGEGAWEGESCEEGDSREGARASRHRN
mmetsp:Transcript_14833/g.33199  ORF Transcript_14833/g.33199 Transcript_14833/m.33199 type:complete len:213 (+) Transcript_14833:297-935(+)